MNRKRSHTRGAGKTLPYLITGGIVLLVLAVIMVRLLLASLFFSPKDRLNLVFYGANTVYYSLGKSDGVDYFISFYPDLKVTVPGGYGENRVGGLGKLVEIEKKPDIFRKTFSVTTSSTVDRYFYQPSQNIYYGQDKLDVTTLKTPSPGDIFFMVSDSNLFDRLYIFFQFAKRGRDEYGEIDYRSYVGNDEMFFQDKDFVRRYQGYLYNRVYRTEQKTVQILYPSSYKTALYLSKVIEGDGIRVTDLSEYDAPSGGGGKCQVTEDAPHFSQSARAIAGFFGCTLTKGNTVSSDIIMKLGSSEKDWDVL